MGSSTVLVLPINKMHRVISETFWLLLVMTHLHQKSQQISIAYCRLSYIQQPIDHAQGKMRGLPLYGFDQAGLIARDGFKTVQDAPKDPVSIVLWKPLE